MRRTLWCGGLLALVALAGCGGDDGLSPASLAGTWSGTTSQGRQFSFTVTAQGITSATIEYQLSGSFCSYTATVTTSGPAVAINSSGNFTISSLPMGANAFMDATGHFSSATQANGTATVDDGQCNGAASFTWTASKN